MKPVVEICLGSSCFSRGNAITLERLERTIAELSLSEAVELKGRLCTGNCADGPCITIAGTTHHQVHPDAAEDLLRYHLEHLINESGNERGAS